MEFYKLKSWRNSALKNFYYKLIIFKSTFNLIEKYWIYQIKFLFLILSFFIFTIFY